MSYKVIQDKVDLGDMFLNNYVHKFALPDTSNRNLILNLLDIPLSPNMSLNIYGHILIFYCINHNRLLFYNSQPKLYVFRICITYQLSLNRVDTHQGDICFSIYVHMPSLFSKFQNKLALLCHIFVEGLILIFHMGILQVGL